MVDGDSKALGNIHTITSPYFETEFYPEACILKAVIYFKRCNYDRSQEAINEFNAIYPDLRKEVDGILAKYPDNAQFYDYIMKIKSGEAGLVRARAERRRRRARRPLAAQEHRVGRRARPRAQGDRQGRPGVEVDRGRRQHPPGSDAAEVARGERRRPAGAQSPAASGVGDSGPHEAGDQDRVSKP